MQRIRKFNYIKNNLIKKRENKQLKMKMLKIYNIKNEDEVKSNR